LTIYPTSPSLRCVNLHASPLLDIRTVTLSSPTDQEALLPTPVSFSHTSPIQPLPQRNDQPIEIKSHIEIKRKTWAGMAEQDEGELAVLVSNGWVRLVQKGDAVDFAPIMIQIDYSLHLGAEITEGIVFRRDTESHEVCPGLSSCMRDLLILQVPHMFLSPTSHTAARIWTPCVDSMWERCTWELEFTVPNTISNTSNLPPVTVVSSGELMEQVSYSNQTFEC
jgi:transcription initiation factor TFIID subunit 2